MDIVPLIKAIAENSSRNDKLAKDYNDLNKKYLKLEEQLTVSIKIIKEIEEANYNSEKTKEIIDKHYSKNFN